MLIVEGCSTCTNQTQSIGATPQRGWRIMKPAASYCCVTVGCVSHTPAFVSAIIVDAVPTDPTRSNSTHTHTLKPGAARCIRFFLFFFWSTRQPTLTLATWPAIDGPKKIASARAAFGAAPSLPVEKKWTAPRGGHYLERHARRYETPTAGRAARGEETSAAEFGMWDRRLQNGDLVAGAGDRRGGGAAAAQWR